MTWKQTAKHLAFGQSKKVECCAPGSLSLYVRNEVKGISCGPCFRCGFRDFQRHEGLSFAEIMRMRKSDNALRHVYKPATVPIEDGPSEARLWLLKAGLSPEECGLRYGIRWASKYNRVILPLTVWGKSTGAFIARAVHGQKPKYIASSNATGVYWTGGPQTSVCCVVVEDVLSAIKVSRAGYMAVAGNGTAFSTDFCNTLPSSNVVAWLDPDAAGGKGWVDLRKAMGLNDNSLVRVQSDRDPKFHSSQQIRGLVEGALLDRP